MEQTGDIMPIKWQSKYLLRQKEVTQLFKQCCLDLKHHCGKIIIFLN